MLAPVLWIALIVLAGALRPGYSHVSQYISELAERGSPTATLMRVGGFGLTGLMYVAFAAALRETFGREWSTSLAAALVALNGLGRLGAGIFPCEPGCSGLTTDQRFHHLFASLGFLAGVLAALLWGVILRHVVRLRLLARASVAAGLLAALALLLLRLQGDSGRMSGLFELAASAILSSWIVVFAVSLLRHSHHRLES